MLLLWGERPLFFVALWAKLPITSNMQRNIRFANEHGIIHAVGHQGDSAASHWPTECTTTQGWRFGASRLSDHLLRAD